MSERLLRIPDAAERLAIGTTKLYDLINGGGIRAVKLGSVWRIPESAVDEFIETLPENQDGLTRLEAVR